MDDEMEGLTGRLAPERIRMRRPPALPEGIVERVLRLEGDLTGTFSDVMDKKGLPGVIAAAVLRPTIPGTRIVGPAFTMRNIVQDQHDPYEYAKVYRNRIRGGGMAEPEAHNLSKPGDVLVIDGVRMVSNMGGISARLGKRQGQVGAIVHGGIRDVGDQRAVGYPIWALDVTPQTGKWRVETIEINGPVQIAGVRVAPGDLVVADDNGVCFVPRDRVLDVVEGVEQQAAAEKVLCDLIDAGTPVTQIPNFTPKD